MTPPIPPTADCSNGHLQVRDGECVACGANTQTAGEGKFSPPQGDCSPSLDDQKIIERLATEVMGWERSGSHWLGYNEEPEAVCEDTEDTPFRFSPDDEEMILPAQKAWNPLTDWNHWRQVEKKILESLIHNNDLFDAFCDKLCVVSIGGYMDTDLPTRCKALLSALDSLKI